MSINDNLNTMTICELHMTNKNNKYQHMKKIIFSIFLFATIMSSAQDKKAYQIYDNKGNFKTF